MGKLNILKGAWEGKVGQTVGAKWKNRNTIRTYSKPSNPDTPAQQAVRNAFKDMSKYVATFSDQIKYLTSLDTRGQSVRNAIIQANKAVFNGGTFQKANLVVNKGGLPVATNVQFAKGGGGANIAVTFTAPQASNISEGAKFVCVAVNSNGTSAVVGESLLNTGTCTINQAVQNDEHWDIFYWILDFRGSAKVGSLSTHQEYVVA